MKIDKDHVVSLHYTLRNDQGETLDSSADGDPLSYLHGAQGIIPGLEKELLGKEIGDQFVVVIQPADAYGEFNEVLIDEVPREAFGEVDLIEVGTQFQAGDEKGNTRVVTIKAVGEDSITVDANHPLAGQVLHFDVTVKDIRLATQEEIEHGHPH
jgi:FKBP-type peptidyl-prolyl cis-trans isomerase SlyD